MQMPVVPVQAIDHINLSTRDLGRAIRFYRDSFGFQIREDHRDLAVPYVILGADAKAYLAIYEEADTRPPRHAFISHWGFVVGDLDAARARLRELGVPWLYPERNAGLFQWAQSRSSYVADPDGHEIELVEKFGGGLG